jgi:hypothetical protein
MPSKPKSIAPVAMCNTRQIDGVFHVSFHLMPTPNLHVADTRFARLETVERLLQEYRMTKDRRLLRRAIELWDEIEAESTLRATRSQKHVH